MSDLISREDAINAFWEDSDIRTAEVRATLRALPSAEPKCGSCKHYEPKYDVCHAPEFVKQVTSKLNNPCDSLLTDDSAECKEHTSKLESADAVQGEWEHWGSPFSDESEVIDTIVCSVCGARFFEPKDEPKGEYNYCPSCGARMKAR